MATKTVGHSYLCGELKLHPNSHMLADVEFTNFRTDTKDSIYHEPALTGYPGVLVAKSVHSLGAKR